MKSSRWRWIQPTNHESNPKAQIKPPFKEKTSGGGKGPNLGGRHHSHAHGCHKMAEVEPVKGREKEERGGETKLWRGKGRNGIAGEKIRGRLEGRKS
ncbi:hypothetical protein D8674_024735 [Pyrus ussuriensis x Pyrus communis]|uniref:Uncharacterized protein n=1 Tax=Pyrus ussuriensis x Pyrus communis TaxID=2448454 RepID=A0A5N5H7R9_9ROSA|nr:hypothetical protein D8674_024735 [Pyrus ussuriensis x Pyrus communis]